MTPQQLDQHPKAVLIRTARALGWRGNEAQQSKYQFVAWLALQSETRDELAKVAA